MVIVLVKIMLAMEMKKKDPKSLERVEITG